MNKKPAKQIVRIINERVIDYQEIPDNYEKKEWLKIPFNKSSSTFFKKHKVELNKDLMLSVVVNSSDRELVQCMVVPTQEPLPEEMIFDSKEDAQKFLRENQIKPSISVVPEEFKKQVEDFFNGKVCFFKDAKSLYEDFVKERDGKKDFNAFEARNIVRKYENKIIDILFDTIPTNQ